MAAYRCSDIVSRLLPRPGLTLLLCWPPSLLQTGFLKVAGGVAAGHPQWKSQHLSFSTCVWTQGADPGGSCLNSNPSPNLAIQMCSLIRPRTHSLPVARGSGLINTEAGISTLWEERAATGPSATTKGCF